MRTCVSPEGKFVYGIHKPSYTVQNMRQDTTLQQLGKTAESTLTNARNFPATDVQVEQADWIFEIANPLSFRGTTYIDKEWADASANNYSRIRLTHPKEVSLHKVLRQQNCDTTLFSQLPAPVLLSLATCSTDPEDLIMLAHLSCEFHLNENGIPETLDYQQDTTTGSIRAVIHDHPLFEAVANNPHLPDKYRIVMVLRPGAQGGSEIVGEWPMDKHTHIYEYLRRNSYIAGGHYAANMADDAIRYSIAELSLEDMHGLRHLYYQRTYLRLAEELGVEASERQQKLSSQRLENLRQDIFTSLQSQEVDINSTLWGWNFGFDYAPSRYRLHASHQQIHQQYAMLPKQVHSYCDDPEKSIGMHPSFGCGDMVAEVIAQYKEAHDSDFFPDYQAALHNNKRMDGRQDLENSLILWQDEHVMLYVPKAQTSQWELQLMTRCQEEETVGNVVEAGQDVRASLDRGIFYAQKALAALGARMVTSIEFPKRIGKTPGSPQPLLYSFLPRLPESPGAFSEAQLRFINGHYPEDFAAVCRQQLKTLL